MAKFVESLKQIKLVEYNRSEKKLLRDAIPLACQKDYKIFHKILSNPASLELGKAMPMPDFPPLSYFEDPFKELTALHDVTWQRCYTYTANFVCLYTQAV